MKNTDSLQEKERLNLPKITIVTPVKNSVNSLEKAIQSLVAQNYPNLEYIVLDGGSKDGTLDIIKKYENFISHWESKNDNGNVVAYIEGIKKANSEIIAFLNADDFYEPNTLLKAGQEFAQNPELDMVSFCFKTLKKDGENLQVIEKSQVAAMHLDRNKIIQILGINARFFKKELFFRYGLPQEQDDQGRMFLSNDLEYMIRFVLNGVRNKTIDYVGYNYISHDNSLTFSKNFNTQIRLCEDKIYIAKKFLNSSEFQLPKIWQKTFKKWIKKYRASIVKMNLKQRNFKEAKKNICLGAKESGALNFFFYLVKIIFRH